MRLVKQQHRIIPQEEGLQGIYKQIELAARVCYKSEDKITEGSAEKLVQRLIDSKHYAMLEHGTVYLTIPCTEWETFIEFSDAYGSNPYTDWDDSECEWGRQGNVYITTNYRVIIENHWEDDLQFMCEPTENHVKRYSVLFTTSRQIAMELLRHRVMSFSMESTRYCNYSKGKFGNEITCITPIGANLAECSYNFDNTEDWLELTNPERVVLKDFVTAEYSYFKALNYGWTAQQAAVVLPNALKADIMITGFIDGWNHLFDLRVKGTTGAPHPQMKALMEPVYNEFVEKGYL